jgi:hypothetical protein
MADQSSIPAVDTSTFAKASDMPTAATTAPPSVADSSALGTQNTVYALSNHTHASKARKARMTSAADGSLVWTFSPPFTNGVTPIISAIAETASGVTDVINVQIEGTPTSTSASLRVTRTNRSTVALIGLTVLSLPTSPGATVVHAIALEP